MDEATADLTNKVIAALIAETERIAARPIWVPFAQLAGVTAAALLLGRCL